MGKYLLIIMICMSANTFASSFLNPNNDFNVSPLEPSIVGADHTFSGFLKKLSNGRIIHVFRLDPGESGNHVGSTGGIAKRFSDDDGKTWSIPEIIYKDEYDDRVGSGGILDNGEIIVFFGRLQMTGIWTGYYVDVGYISSKDNGDTWSGMNYVEAAGKSLLFMDIFKIPGKSGYFCTTYGSYYADIRYSEDGYSWDSVYTKFDYRVNHELNIAEPIFTPIGDGKIIGLFRVDRTSVHQTVSADNGITWSTPVPTTLANGSFCSYPFNIYDEKLNKLYTIVCDRQGADYDVVNYNSGAWVYCNDPNLIFDDPHGYGNCRFVLRGNPNIFRQLGYPYSTKINDSTYLVIMSDTYKKVNSLEDAESYQFYINISKDVYILKTQQTISFVENQEISIDTAIYEAAYASSGLPINYSSSDESIIKIINNKIVPQGIGSCLLTACQFGDNNYYQANPVTVKVNVVKANQYISFDFKHDAKIGDPEIKINFQSKTNNPITFLSSDTNVARIEFDKIRIIGSGVCYITAKQEENSYYLGYTTTPLVLVVAKNPQTIDFHIPPVITINQPAIDLLPTSSAGLPIVYECSDTDIAIVSNNKLYIKKAGICLIYANQSGNSEYEAAKMVVKTLKVEKLNQAINFNLPPSILADKEWLDLNAASNSGLPLNFDVSDTSVAKINGEKLMIIGSGYCTVRASQDGNDIYNEAIPVVKSINIEKLNQKLQFEIPPVVTLDNAEIGLNGVASSGLKVEYEVSDSNIAEVLNGKLKIKKSGFCVVTARQRGNNIFNSISINKTIKIEKLNQSVSFNLPATINANSKLLEINATSSSGLQVDVQSSDSSVAYIENNKLIIVSSGVCSISAKQDGNETYNPSITVTKAIKIDKVDQTIDFILPNIAFVDSKDLDLNPVSVSNLKLSFSVSNNNVAEIINDKLHIKASGICVVTARQDGNQLYNPAKEMSKLINVLKYSQNIDYNLSKKQLFVNDSDMNLIVSSNSGLPVLVTISDTSILSYKNGKYYALKEGVCNLILSQLGNAVFDKAETIFLTVQVNRKPQTLSTKIPSKLFVFDSLPTYSIASSGLPVAINISDPSVIKIENNHVIALKSGTTIIEVTQSGDKEYLPSSLYRQSISVLKSNQKIEEFDPPAELVYLNEPFKIYAKSSSGLPVSFYSTDSNVVKIKNDSAYIVSPGYCNIIATQSGNDFFNAAEYEIRNVKILKAEQNIKFETIQTLVFGDAPIGLQAISSSGLDVKFVISDTSVANIQDNRLNIVGAGSTTITAVQKGNKYYNSANEIIQNITVKKALQVLYFEKLPAFEYTDTVLIANVKSNSNGKIILISSDTSIASISGDSIKIVGAGQCIISAQQMGNDNYYPSLKVLCDLDVKKLPQTLQFDLQNTFLVSDSAVLLQASSSSHLPVSFKSSNPSVAFVDGNILHIISAGICTISAMQEGDRLFMAAESISRELKIIEDTVTKSNIIIGYPNPAKDKLFFKNSNCSTVQIFDNKGKIVITIKLNDSGDPIDISNLSPGMYFANVITPTQTKAILFNKQ